VVPHLGDADIERIVYAGASRRIEDLGRRVPFFTAGLRRGIQLRDRRCTEPGCNTPADECDVDHIIPRAKGGRTDQDNGQLKCPHHNRHKGTRTA
jgi:5-methylcytosine-specific restriction endonuclease McrA